MNITLIFAVAMLAAGLTGCSGTKKQKDCVEGGKPSSFWTSEMLPVIAGAEFCKDIAEPKQDAFIRYVIYDDAGKVPVDYLKSLEEELKKKGWLIEKINTDAKLGTVSVYASGGQFGRTYFSIGECWDKGMSYRKCTEFSFSIDNK